MKNLSLKRYVVKTKYMAMKGVKHKELKYKVQDLLTEKIAEKDENCT